MAWRAVYMYCLLLVACTSQTQKFDSKPVPIGNFRLAQMVPRVGEELAKGPFSRTASGKEWIAAIDIAFKDRFFRFEGGSYYHLGVTVNGYILAKPGIPLVAAPKSVLIFSVIVIEDHTGKVLTEKPHQITVLEQLGSYSLIGSGYTRSREQQLTDLATQAAFNTETWLRGQPWFFGSDTIAVMPDGVKIDHAVVAQSDTQ